MNSLFVLALCASLLAIASGAVITEAEVTPMRQVCYDHYGCFGTESPWTSLLRPVSALPNAPYEIGTRFLLFTRSNRVEDVELMPDNEFILNFSPYDGSKKTIVLIHGFTDSHRAEWVINAKNALLDEEDVNIIAVDWAPGASSNYLKASANSRLAGAQVYRFVNFLVNKGNLNLDELRVVGHSIGAHVAGYAGHRFDGQIGHITALDASDAYFAGTDPIVRLDPTDAKHVHSIQTDGNHALRIGMGILAPVGHVNLYPNGGKGQPGCSGSLGSLIGSIFDIIFLNFDNIPKTWACSHVRSAEFYVESISSKCPFVAFNCDSYANFNNGKCVSSCQGQNSCTVLGYGSEKTLATTSGSFYLNTNSKGSYCQQTVRFDSPVAQSQAKTNGKVAVTFRRSDGTTSDKFTVADGSISNGQILNSWVHVSSEAFASTDDKPSLVLRYTRGGLLPTTQPKYLALDNINIYLIDENLQLQLVSYPAVTLEAGVDAVVDAL